MNTRVSQGACANTASISKVIEIGPYQDDDDNEFEEQEESCCPGCMYCLGLSWRDFL